MQLELRDCLLDLGWVPRDENTEADAITNDDVGEFREANRIPVDFQAMDFIKLPELLKFGDAFFEEQEKRRKEGTAARATVPARAEAVSARAVRRRRRGPLRAVDPW